MATDTGRKQRETIKFDVTLDNGQTVNVTYTPSFMHHMEFRGPISETGYRSHFPQMKEAFDLARKSSDQDRKMSLKQVKILAKQLAQEFWQKNPAKHGQQQKIM